MAARDQARWVPAHRPQGRRTGEALQPPGNDLTDRFSLIVEALAGLRSRSCIIDGEAVACDERGIAAFDLIRYRRNDGCVFLYAFDLIELNGDDLRRDPLVVRKATLTSVLAKAGVASGSTSIWNSTTARPCSTTPAGWGWKASSASGRTRPIAPAARRIGSRRRPGVRGGAAGGGRGSGQMNEYS